MNKLTPIAIATAVMLGLVSATAQAATISLDFNTPTSPTETGTVDSNATGLELGGPAGSWNVLNLGSTGGVNVSTSPTISNMVDDNGNPTTVDFTWNTGGNSWRAFDPGSGSDALRRDVAFVRNGQTSSTISWQLTGLFADTQYQLILFGQTGPANAAAFTAEGNAPSLFDSEFDGNFFIVTSDSLGRISGTMSADTSATNDVGAISGLQIAPIPAPAALPAGLTLLGLAAFRRRRR